MANGYYAGHELLNVTITSADGKLVADLKGNLTEINSELHQIFHTQSGGVYVLRIITNGSQNVIRVVKE
jgi:hypothetical protein